MDTLPHKESLVSQVVEVIIRRISEGVWKEWLPNERTLCEMLHVSRNTLRSALSHLARRNIVKPIRPIGTKILLQTPQKLARKTRTIGLLTPEPLNRMRPNVVLIIDELRAQLSEVGYLLRAHHGERYFNPNSQLALQKLIKNNPHDCWLLLLSTEKIKKWFLKNRVNCVISGSCTEEAMLPFVDIDFRALCRHAVGQLAAAGHQRIAFLMEKTSAGGDIESEIGFLEGIKQARHPGTEGQIFHYQHAPAALLKLLDRLFNSKHPPTALLVSNPHFCLLAHTYLQNKGLRIPRDVSIISRDDDPFLSFIHPNPTRYLFNPHIFAKKLFKLIMQVTEEQNPTQTAVRIMPDYFKGETLAPYNSQQPAA